MNRGTENRVRSYLRQVDSLMGARVGVSFTDIQTDVSDAAGIDLAAEMRRGISPTDFVGLVCRTFPLRPVDGEAGPDVARANRGTMALAVFARASEDWGLGADGAAYRSGGDGVERMSYGLDRTGRHYGFVVSLAEDAALSHDAEGRPGVPEGTEFVPVAGALDIGDAVERFENAMEARRNAAPSMH